MYKDDQGGVQSKKKPNKKGKKEEGKKGLMAMYDSDVHVADVLSYRYSTNIQNLINFYQINVIDWIFTFTWKFAMD